MTRPTRGERRFGLRATRGGDEQRLQREVDPIGHGVVPHDQRDGSARTVFGLGQEIDRDPRRIDGVVRDDRDLGGARDPVDADDAEHLSFGLGDERVAGPDDDVDRPQGTGAERHRRDRLRATDRIDLVDPGDRRRGEDRVVHVPGRVGWRAEHDFAHTGDAGGQHGHQHRRSQRCAPPGT